MFFILYNTCKTIYIRTSLLLSFEQVPYIFKGKVLTWYTLVRNVTLLALCTIEVKVYCISHYVWWCVHYRVRPGKVLRVFFILLMLFFLYRVHCLLWVKYYNWYYPVMLKVLSPVTCMRFTVMSVPFLGKTLRNSITPN